MAKFKKNFWREREVVNEETGKKVSVPEPEWYARQYDPIDRLGGFKGIRDPRPEGATIPKVQVGDRLLKPRDAYEVYHKDHPTGLNFVNFKTALINGTSFKTSRGEIRKPKG